MHITQHRFDVVYARAYNRWDEAARRLEDAYRKGAGPRPEDVAAYECADNRITRLVSYGFRRGLVETPL